MSESSKKPYTSQLSFFPLTQGEQQPSENAQHTIILDENDNRAKDEGKKSRKGEAHTAWHPLFAETLALYLPPGYRLLTEYQLTLAPQRIDVVIREDESGGGPLQGLPAIMTHLTRYNLFEFKSPLDEVEVGDYTKLVGYAMQFYVKDRPFPLEQLSLFLVAPKWKEALEKECQDWNLQWEQVMPGLYRLDHSLWKSWFLESDVLGQQPENNILGLFSEAFAEDPKGWMQTSTVSIEWMIWIIQQLAAYRERSHNMPLLHEKELDNKVRQALRDYVASLPLEELQQTFPQEKLQRLLQSLPAEERLKGVPAEERLKGVPAEERLKGVPAEERLKGVPAEERLKGVPAEERLKGLTPEELEKLKNLLN